MRKLNKIDSIYIPISLRWTMTGAAFAIVFGTRNENAKVKPR